MARRIFHWCSRMAMVLAAIGAGAARNGAEAAGGGKKVDVELVMAVDISYSMDVNEQRLQRAGYVQALQSADFLNALKSGPYGQIAIKYLQWASYNDQDTLLDWTLIDGPESAKAAADKLARAPYRRAQRTSISGAIDASARSFPGNGFDGLRQVIDISGDGPNNTGRPVLEARDEAVAKGITINGLPLVGIRPWLGAADIKDLDIYYEDCVVGGSDGFMIVIHDQKQFIEATRTKLVREIAWREPKMPIMHAAAQAPRISCTIGENLWRRRWED